MQIATEKLPELLIVSLCGRLDSTSTPEFQSSMREIIASGEARVVIDCSELRYVSSVGIGAFVQSAQTLGAAGGSLSFVGLTQHVRSVFEMVGLITFFQIFSSRQDAIKKFETAPGPAVES